MSTTLIKCLTNHQSLVIARGRNIRDACLSRVWNLRWEERRQMQHLCLSHLSSTITPFAQFELSGTWGDLSNRLTQTVEKRITRERHHFHLLAKAFITHVWKHMLWNVMTKIRVIIITTSSWIIKKSWQTELLLSNRIYPQLTRWAFKQCVKYGRLEELKIKSVPCIYFLSYKQVWSDFNPGFLPLLQAVASTHTIQLYFPSHSFYQNR